MAAGRPRLLVSLYNAEQEYQQMQASDAQAAAARAGVDAEIVFCNGSTALQRKQIETALQAPPGSRPVAVVVQPYALAGLDSVARMALQSGVGWVVLGPDINVDNLRQEFPDKLVALVSTDHRQIGALQAKLFRTLLPRGGKVLNIEGPSLSPAVLLRREGLRDGLRDSQVEIVKTIAGDWGEQSAEKAVTFWIKLGSGVSRPDLVGSQNDSMAVGARRAFQTLKPAWLDVPFTGCDGLPGGGLRLVREKVLTATVVNPTTTGAAIELVVAALRGQPCTPNKYLAPSLYPDLAELERRVRG